jgi:hypothetical protein
VEIYRFVWGVVAVVATATALVYDVATGGLLRLALMGPVVAVFGALLGFSIAEERPDRWTWTRRAAVWAALAAVAADGLVATSGALGLLVGAVLVLLSPPAIGLGWRWVFAWSSRRSGGPPEVMVRRDLLRRWEWTTAEVRRSTTTVARRLVLVEERRQLLDELQRRDPAYFAEWVATAVPEGPLDRRRLRGH